ncbi:MAG: TIGR03085 family metal-binding protein [Propioniciclava sp.]
MGFAKQERAALCDALIEAGPEAPTLCEGWSAHDLAAHVWVRENDPIAVPGVLIKPLNSVTSSRMDAVKTRWTYAELVDRIRRGPGLASLFAIPAVDEKANTGEFFVHTEDVRRPAGLVPRPTEDEFEATMADMLASMAKALMRDARCGIIYERTDVAESLRVRPGTTTVTVIGKPSELYLFSYGRMQDARVELVGESEAVATLLGEHKAF